jgi:hypothetical protein
MNLIEGIQAECNRLRDVVIPQYDTAVMHLSAAAAQQDLFDVA